MSGTHIQSIHARHIIDCKTRGLVEVDVVTESGALGRASAPPGPPWAAWRPMCCGIPPRQPALPAPAPTRRCGW